VTGGAEVTVLIGSEKVLSPHGLEYVFRHEVLKMLKAEGKIGDSVIENMMSWHHSGFNVVGYSVGY
jgi:hypothetical protein